MCCLILRPLAFDWDVHIFSCCGDVLLSLQNCISEGQLLLWPMYLLLTGLKLGLKWAICKTRSSEKVLKKIREGWHCWYCQRCRRPRRPTEGVASSFHFIYDLWSLFLDKYPCAYDSSENNLKAYTELSSFRGVCSKQRTTAVISAFWYLNKFASSSFRLVTPKECLDSPLSHAWSVAQLLKQA